MKEELEKTKGKKNKCKIHSIKGLNVSKSQFIVGWDQLPVKGNGTARGIDYITCNPLLPIKKQVLSLTDLKQETAQELDMRLQRSNIAESIYTNLG